jgi:5-formyltetrahydrofolate cyclo-ligase
LNTTYNCITITQFGFAVALSYSQQILDDGVIPVTSTDVLVDALVSPEGVIPISSAAFNRYH